MGTIVVIVAFLLAASASPIDQSPHDSSGEFSGTNVQDDQHSSTDEVPSDVDKVSGEGDTIRHDEETGSSGGGDDSQTHDEETPSPGDMLSVSTGSDANNNSGMAVSTSLSTATSISTEGPIDLVTDTTNVTQPPDADPYDCQNRNPLTHIYEACTFLCGGDMVATARDYSTCLLNYTGNFTEKSEPTRLEKNATGVCLEGKCIPKPNNVTETTPESSTATTTTTTSTTTTTPTISETTPEPSMADTVANTETSDPGSPTTHKDTDVGIDISSQSPSSQLGDGLVAME